MVSALRVMVCGVGSRVADRDQRGSAREHQYVHQAPFILSTKNKGILLCLVSTTQISKSADIDFKKKRDD